MKLVAYSYGERMRQSVCNYWKERNYWVVEAVCRGTVTSHCNFVSASPLRIRSEGMKTRMRIWMSASWRCNVPPGYFWAFSRSRSLALLFPSSHFCIAFSPCTNHTRRAFTVGLIPARARIVFSLLLEVVLHAQDDREMPVTPGSSCLDVQW